MESYSRSQTRRGASRLLAMRIGIDLAGSILQGGGHRAVVTGICGGQCRLSCGTQTARASRWPCLWGELHAAATRFWLHGRRWYGSSLQGSGCGRSLHSRSLSSCRVTLLTTIKHETRWIRMSPGSATYTSLTAERPRRTSVVGLEHCLPLPRRVGCSLRRSIAACRWAHQKAAGSESLLRCWRRRSLSLPLVASYGSGSSLLLSCVGCSYSALDKTVAVARRWCRHFFEEQTDGWTLWQR